MSHRIPRAAIVAAVTAALAMTLSSTALTQRAPRARDLGVPFDGTPGAANAITDVAGVTVGHSTIISGEGPLRVGSERQYEGPQPSFPGQGAEPAEDLPVAEVETVEIPHRHRRGTGGEAGIVETAVSEHAPTS
jgi:hypothetical protein